MSMCDVCYREVDDGVACAECSDVADPLGPARGGALALANIGAAIAGGELALAAFELTAELPHPDYIARTWHDEAMARALRRLNRARTAVLP